jgi:hypothetical protein
MYIVVFYVGKYVWVYVGVYTKSKSSELSPLRQKLLRFAKQFPPPLRSNKKSQIFKLCEYFALLKYFFNF